MPVFGFARAALAAEAARGGQILPALLPVCTAEALTAPLPRRAAELNAEAAALCAAAQELALCRMGWLRLCPAARPLPVCLSRALLHATVLTFLRGVLRCGGTATVRLASPGSAALLVLQGGRAGSMPGDLPVLLHRCGAAVTVAGAPYAAAVRLPLAPALPLRPPTTPEELLFDRYSAAHIFLHGYCAEDV